MLTFVLASTATAQHPPRSATSSSQHEPITEDLSHGATFTFKIAPNLPEFMFKIIPEPYPRDEYGNPHTTVREVQVFREGAKQPVQSLEDCELSDMEAPRSGSEWFRAIDMNFDGYKDIYMLTSWEPLATSLDASGCTIRKAVASNSAKTLASLVDSRSIPRQRPSSLTAMAEG